VIRGRTNRSAAIAVAAVIALQSFRASGAEPVRSTEIVESGVFLEGYRAASEAQSAEFYDLYSDRAVIHIRTQDQDRGIAFQGRAFKAWGRQLLKEGRGGLDGSIFRDATVEQRGSRLLIRAKRYSTTRCYWDLTYQVGIEREGLSYRVVDERLTTNPAARCEPERIAADVSRTMILPPSEFGLSPTLNSARPLDARSAEWRPVSQQELADKAMQLAEQMATAHAALSSPTNAAATASIGAEAHPAVSFERGPTVASTARSDASSDLRITPTE
jgi:hypothetical protein